MAISRRKRRPHARAHRVQPQRDHAEQHDAEHEHDARSRSARQFGSRTRHRCREESARRTSNTAWATRAPARRARSTAGSARCRRETDEMPHPAPRAVMSGRGSGNSADLEQSMRGMIPMPGGSRASSLPHVRTVRQRARSSQTPRTPIERRDAEILLAGCWARPARNCWPRGGEPVPAEVAARFEAARRQRRAPVCPSPIFWAGANSGRWSSPSTPPCWCRAPKPSC